MISNYDMEAFQRIDNKNSMMDTQMQIQHDLEVMGQQDDVRPSYMKPLDFQPLPLELRQRNKDYPSGLKNIGNGKSNFYFIFICNSMLFQFPYPSIFLSSKLLRKDNEFRTKKHRLN